MVATSVTLQSLPDQAELPDGTDGIYRPRTDVVWAGGTGPFNVRYEWDTVNTFDSGSLITQTNSSVTSPDTEIPLSDLGDGTETNWFYRATVIDTGDASSELASAINEIVYVLPRERDRFLTLQTNVSVAYTPFDAPLEVQIIYNDATGGTFTLSFNGQGPSSAINYNDAGTTIASELEAFSNITDVTVEALGAMVRGHANAWRVTFVDPTGSQPLITANDASLTGHTVGTTIYEDQDGDSWTVTVPSDGTVGADGQQNPSTIPQVLTLQTNLGVGFDGNQANLGDDPLEVQVVYNDATGGTFTLSFDGQGPTSAINYNATPAAVESALEVLSNIVSVRVVDSVVRGASASWQIEFLDPRGTSEPLLTADDTGLTGETIGTTIFQVFDGGDWDDATGEGTVGPDGQVNPSTVPQILTLQTNLGVGFQPTDGVDLGAELLTPAGTKWWPGDGFNIAPSIGDVDYETTNLLDQLLTKQLNVTVTQPCPWIFTATPSVARVGDAIVITGQGLVNADSPTADPYGAVVRLYESPSFAAAYDAMTIVSWISGDTLDQIVIQVPAGAASGHLAVVHTTTPTCDGSNFKYMEILDAVPDPDAGWWIEAWNIRGDARIVGQLPVDVGTAFFQKVKNEVGSGWVTLPAQIDDPAGVVDNLIDVICNPKATPKVETLIRVYLDGILRYGFFARFRSDPYGEPGNRNVRLSGPGREEILLWPVVGRADQGLSNEIKNPDPVYGSTVELVPNGDMEDNREIISNGTFETLEVDPWEPTGTATINITQTEQRSGAAGMRVVPAATSDGARTLVNVSPGSHAYLEGWVKDAGVGATADVRFYYEDDGGTPVVLDSDSVTMSTAYKQLQIDAVIPQGVTQVYYEWRNTSGSSLFWVDDNIGIAAPDPWLAKGSGTVITIDRTQVDTGLNSLKVVTGAQNDGARNVIKTTPNTTVSFTARVAGPIGERVRFRALLNGVAIKEAKDLTATNVYETFTLTGVTGPDQTIILLDVQGRETAAQTFYVDNVTGYPGNPAASGGTIFGDLLTAAQLRSVIPFAQWAFTGTLDSKGQVYADNELSLALRHNQPILNALDQLVAFGLEWEVTDDYEIRLLGELGSDLTQLPDGEGPMLDAGKPIVGGDIEGENPRATFFHAEGAGGITTSGSNPTWEATLERRESWITNPGAADTPTLGKLVTAALAAEDARGLAIKLEVARASTLRPFVDFDVGDTINVDIPQQVEAATGATTSAIQGAFRVIAIAVRLDGEGSGVVYTVDLNRLEYERSAKVASALARLIARGEEQSGLGADAGIGAGTIGGTSIPVTTSPSTGGGSTLVPDHDHVFGDSADPTVGGDLGGQLPNPTVVALKGIPITATPSVDLDLWWYDSAANLWRAVLGTAAEHKIVKVVDQGGGDLAPQWIDDNDEIWHYTDATDPLVAVAGNIEVAVPPTWTGGGVILGAYIRVNVAPTDADLIIDIHKNGTTIYTTQANRPTITAAAFDSGAAIAVPDVTAFVARDYFTVDVDQVGSTVPGSRLVVDFIVRRINV